MKRDGRVNQHYVDPASDSNILVYDGNQYVAYMDAETKAGRKALYRLLNMGGTTDWATDLQKYNSSPTRGGEALAESWSSYATDIQNGLDPWQVGNRTGNWTEVHCSDRSVSDMRYLSSSERWSMIDAPHAWADAIEVWRNIDRKGGKISFSASISDSFNAPPNAECGSFLETDNCAQTQQCKEFDNDGAGPAGWMIWNSLVMIHEVCGFFPKRLTMPYNGLDVQKL